MNLPECIELRRLAGGEIDLMNRMLDLFGEVFGEPETYGAARPDAGYTRRLLDSENFIAIAALESDSVVGALTAYELQKFEQARSEIYIYDLAVAASHRRRGIATALIRKVVEIGVARNAWVVMIQADRGDDAPIALYDKLGRGEEILHFDIPVGPDRGGEHEG